MNLRRRTSQLLFALFSLLAATPIVWYWARLAAEAASDPASAFWHRPFFVSVVVGQAAGLAALGIAIAIAWKAWDQAPAGRTLAFFLAAFCLYNGSFGLITILRALFPGRGALAYDIVFAAAVAVASGTLIRFSAVFPSPPTGPEVDARLWSTRARRLRNTFVDLRPVLAVATTVGAVVLIDGIFDWQGMVGAGLAVELVFPLVFAVAAVNLWTSYLDADTDGRAQIFWVAEGVVLLLLGVAGPVALDLAAGAFGTELPQPVHWYGWALSLWGFVACLGFAVFGRGVIHSALLLRRTTIAGGGTVVILFGFAGLEDLLTNLLVSRTGLPEAAGTWFAGGLIALSLNPLYRWIERRTR